MPVPRVSIVSPALHGSFLECWFCYVLPVSNNQVSLESKGVRSPGDANHEGILTAGATRPLEQPKASVARSKLGGSKRRKMQVKRVSAYTSGGETRYWKARQPLGRDVGFEVEAKT